MRTFYIAASCFLACASYSQDLKTNLPTTVHSFASEKTNQPVIVQLINTSNKSPIIEILNAPSVSALIGLLGALGGFFLADFLNNRKTNREEKRKYKAAVLSARHELSFYAILLSDFGDQTNVNMPEIEKMRTAWVKPSFAVYPSFLEIQKNEICAASKNDELVLNLVECHFNLCHLKEMLTFIEETEVDSAAQRHLIQNIKNVAVLATHRLFFSKKQLDS